MRNASASVSNAAIPKKALERKIGRLELAAHLCAAIVVLGVVLEYGPRFIAFWRTPGWILFEDIIGGLLVSLGIAGEIILSMLASSAERELGHLNDKTIAELNLLAEQERTARIGLEKKVARSLDPEQRSALVRRLELAKGQRKSVTLDPRDRESLNFFEQLRLAMEEAGWEVSMESKFGEASFGISLELVGDFSPRDVMGMSLLAQALNLAGIFADTPSSQSVTFMEGDPGYIAMAIGSKRF